MNLQEFNLLLAGLEQDFRNEKQALFKKYALENNPYPRGSIIESEYCILQIEKIFIKSSNYIGLSRPPYCIYSGPRLKKDLTPFKNGDYESISQDDVKRIL